jgi:hypothetical protein
MGTLTSVDPTPPSHSRFSRWQYALIVLLFAAVEFALFVAFKSGPDVGIYAEYAQRWRDGSLYTLYQPEPGYRVVEYPPLAVAFARLVDLFAQQLPIQGAFYDWLSMPGQTPAERQYQLAYRSVTAILTLLTMIALLYFVERYFADETRRERLERLSVFLVGICCLATVLFDRLDLVLGVMILLAVMLAESGRHWLWSAVMLAAAIGFKITPVILVPFWALATVPTAWFAPLTSALAWGRLTAALVLRCATVVALVVLACLPFYVFGGPGSLSFLKFHADRGIECESTYAAVVAVLGQFGLEVGCNHEYGAFEVFATCTPFMTRMAPYVVGVPLVLLVVTYFLQRYREARGTAVAPRLELVGPIFLALLIFLLGNKVLSPQYFLWLVPLAPVMPLSGQARRCFLLGFALVCISTLVVFPLADRALIGQNLPEDAPYPLSGPNLAGAIILSARSLSMLAVAVGLAVALFRKGPNSSLATNHCSADHLAQKLARSWM